MKITGRRLQPAECAKRLALAVALGAGEAKHLAAVDVEVDVVEARRRSVPPPRSHAGSFEIGLPLRRISDLDRPADHQRDQVVLRKA